MKNIFILMTVTLLSSSSLLQAGKFNLEDLLTSNRTWREKKAVLEDKQRRLLNAAPDETLSKGRNAKKNALCYATLWGSCLDKTSVEDHFITAIGRYNAGKKELQGKIRNKTRALKNSIKEEINIPPTSSSPFNYGQFIQILNSDKSMQEKKTVLENRQRYLLNAAPDENLHVSRNFEKIGLCLGIIGCETQNEKKRRFMFEQAEISYEMAANAIKPTGNKQKERESISDQAPGSSSTASSSHQPDCTEVFKTKILKRYSYHRDFDSFIKDTRYYFNFFKKSYFQADNKWLIEHVVTQVGYYELWNALDNDGKWWFYDLIVPSSSSSTKSLSEQDKGTPSSSSQKRLERESSEDVRHSLTSERNPFKQHAEEFLRKTSNGDDDEEPKGNGSVPDTQDEVSDFQSKVVKSGSYYDFSRFSLELKFDLEDYKSANPSLSDADCMFELMKRRGLEKAWGELSEEGRGKIYYQVTERHLTPQVGTSKDKGKDKALESSEEETSNLTQFKNKILEQTKSNFDVFVTSLGYEYSDRKKRSPNTSDEEIIRDLMTGFGVLSFWEKLNFNDQHLIVSRITGKPSVVQVHKEDVPSSTKSGQTVSWPADLKERKLLIEGVFDAELSDREVLKAYVEKMRGKELIRVNVAGGGDCLAYTLQLSRDEIITQLLKHKEDREIRKLFTFPIASRRSDLDVLFNPSFVYSSDVFEAFVKKEYENARENFDSGATLAIGKIYNFSIFLWTNDHGQLKLVKGYLAPNSQREKHILLEDGHYQNLLTPDASAEEVATALYIEGKSYSSRGTPLLENYLYSDPDDEGGPDFDAAFKAFKAPGYSGKSPFVHIRK
ncbi:MAG: hypothetical protein BGO67_09555 [Alphaproteobacteria bacterium 41-28]|nr:MAG: hypothetical protein BGO67_09555 [Alphaproteobacteria bacterium 41-28]